MIRVFEDDSIDKHRLKSRFKNDRTSIDCDPRYSRPSTTTPENNEGVPLAVQEDGRFLT